MSSQDSNQWISSPVRVAKRHHDNESAEERSSKHARYEPPLVRGEIDEASLIAEAEAEVEEMDDGDDDISEENEPSDQEYEEDIMGEIEKITSRCKNHENISQQDLSTAVGYLFTYWIIQTVNRISIRESTMFTTDDAKLLYGYDTDEVISDKEELDKKYDYYLKQAQTLHCTIMNSEFAEAFNDGSEMKKRFIRCLRMIKECYTTLTSSIHGTMLFVDELSDKLDVDYFMLTAREMKALHPRSKLIIHLLNYAQKHSYKKMEDDVYSEYVLKNPDGSRYYTRSWKNTMSIAEMVRKAVRKEDSLELWQIYVNLNESTIVEHLKNCPDLEFPFLERNRNILSFSNGIYNLSTLSFKLYTENIPMEIVSSRYINQPFPAELATAIHEGQATFKDVATPILDHILLTQKLSNEPNKGEEMDSDQFTLSHETLMEDNDMKRCNHNDVLFPHTYFSVLDWVYIFLGRLFHEVGKLENWQVLLFVKGLAGTGKSCLNALAKQFYEPEDVAVLSSNIEKQFGLSGVYNKKLYLTNEIRRGFKLDQGDLQSMVTGEDVSIAIKNKTPKTVKWTVPGMFVGNEVPAWSNNSGSIGRRIVICAFDTAPQQIDTQLPEKLKAELAQVILKANTAYHHACTLFCGGGKGLGIWDILPSYFKDQRRKLRAQTHVLDNFLQNCSRVSFGNDKKILMETFEAILKKYVRDSGKTTPINWDGDFYNTTFSEYNITIELEEDGDGNVQQVLHGVSVASGFNGGGNEY